MGQTKERFVSQQQSADTVREDIIRMFPGGAVCCHLEQQRLIPEWFSEGLPKFFGYSGEAFRDLLEGDFINAIYPEDRGLVLAAVTTQSQPDVYFRMLHQTEGFKWCRMNGTVDRTDGAVFRAFIMEMSAQAQLFQNMADETADEIYVIHKDTYELLYINHPNPAAKQYENCIGRKCHEALYGKAEPCSFCTLKTHTSGEPYHVMPIEEEERFFETKFHETCWNGIPAYVKYIRDITDDILVRKEKERLEQYFQTVLRYLPGGVAVVCHKKDGTVVPEFLSNGFVEMVEMSYDEAWKLYMEDAMAGVHPDDREMVSDSLSYCIMQGQERYELSYRLKRGTGGYLWVKATFSVIQSEGEGVRVYVGYHDITEERAMQEQMRQQYENMIFQHHKLPGRDTLILGHCNVTKNVILEIDDYTDSALLETFGYERDAFFTGIAGLICDEEERNLFLETYLNAPSLVAFQRGDVERVQNCFVKLPKEPYGRYVQFKVLLVETPDTGDVTGILTVTDTTDQSVREKLVHQLTAESYDLVADVDLRKDQYCILAGMDLSDMLVSGKHSRHLGMILQDKVLPGDREYVKQRLDTQYISQRLEKEGSYSLSYSIIEEKDVIYTKLLKVFAVDLRLGRVCLARTDITESMRQQQGLLNMIAYTFDMACFMNLDSQNMTIYTRDMVLKNLSPHIVSDYRKVIAYLERYYDPEEVADKFDLDRICERLEAEPSGYDFVLGHRNHGEMRYKQINFLWGNETHRTVCMVRADVTDTLAAEYQAKAALEEALKQAKEANQAKSDFLASMSHDIRTPMNAIMGMTSLALSHLKEPDRVEDYLQKISVSSKHLLSLINDILDMSQIEQSRIQLNATRISVTELVDQLRTIMEPQAKTARIRFSIRMGDVSHPYFMGDSLRINQVLINILGNAFKFTEEGGSVDFEIEEVPARQQGGWIRYRFLIRDTGIGMSQEFQEHLFEPFMRSKEALKVEGTGLGLSITKALVDLMGGTIAVESRLHLGTTFRIELEWKAAEEEAAQTEYRYTGQETNETILQGLHFLIVEDNAINSEILREVLKMCGATSTIQENGYLGMMEFQDTPPGTYDAICMDIQMPVMDGLEATAAIRALNRPDAQTIPIIAMTANAFAEDVQASLESGMNAHVAKPINIDEFCGVVARYVRKQTKG